MSDRFVSKAVLENAVEVAEADAWRNGFMCGIAATVVIAAALVALVWRVMG